MYKDVDTWAAGNVSRTRSAGVAVIELGEGTAANLGEGFHHSRNWYVL